MAESLTLIEQLPAPPSPAFHAFVEPVELAKWFWPPRFQTAASLDPRPGGHYSVRSEAVGIGFSGQYLEVLPPRSLSFDWTWDGESLTTTVELAFETAGSATRLRLVHSGFATGQQRDEHVQGWKDCLDRLKKQLAAGR